MPTESDSFRSLQSGPKRRDLSICYVVNDGSPRGRGVALLGRLQNRPMCRRRERGNQGYDTAPILGRVTLSVYA
jgi:hypothetical protein